MTSMIRGVILSFIMFTSRFGIFITVLLYVKFVSHITVENVFFLTCYYNIIKQTLTLYFPQAVGQVKTFFLIVYSQMVEYIIIIYKESYTMAIHNNKFLFTDSRDDSSNSKNTGLFVE